MAARRPAPPKYINIKMYNIYFEYRRLTICSAGDIPDSSADAVIYYPGKHGKLSHVAESFDRNKRIARLYIPTGEIHKTYREICSGLKEINAAGGIVMNGSGEYLMIFRNGKWDLPKGKQEKDESLALTAIREVREECGILRPVQNGLLCITDHTYHMNGDFILKHTYWYRMTCEKDAVFIPQTEEGITKVEWVGKDMLSEYLKESFPSIVEVFSNSGVSADL